MPPTETGKLMEWTPVLREWLEGAATQAGFAVVGLASAAPEGLESSRFAGWIEAGHAGEMQYLERRDERGALLRSSLQTAIPWAESVVVCGFDYAADAPLSIDPAPEGAGWIARYAWSGDAAGRATDYHQELLGRLRKIEAGLRERAECETRCYVDTGPIVERSFAARAGVGWIGKNTCVLNEQLGSWLLLGMVVTSLAIPKTAELAVAADRCGSCTRCLEACPTGALIAPRQMDASLCIAYLTIEKKGSIAEDLRGPMGRQVFGCDICQDVCPWNGRRERQAAHGDPAAERGAANVMIAGEPIEPIEPRTGFEPRAELINPRLAWLAAMDNAAFRRAFRGSPLERTGRKRVQRNVAIAMGNSGDRGHAQQLELWAQGEDAVLAEAAQWALARLVLGPREDGVTARPDADSTPAASLLASDEVAQAEPAGCALGPQR